MGVGCTALVLKTFLAEDVLYQDHSSSGKNENPPFIALPGQQRMQWQPHRWLSTSYPRLEKQKVGPYPRETTACNFSITPLHPPINAHFFRPTLEQELKRRTTPAVEGGCLVAPTPALVYAVSIASCFCKISKRWTTLLADGLAFGSCCHMSRIIWP